ncbi:Rieske (2Fe-2S) protein [Microbispora sp. RL4-1S]|uniref:Rieske (2Fe-2S) protein n=1 Tax=Microbispora oryzae TaxID=2806554 RepID=A0A941AHF7_9ACTN|nr:Rieske (2Fe-2S) protein [Microbispora oryzae]MBP2702657.1 Rieske (2Fe-2S) protein [Microbispora oryzae]
MTGRPEDGPTLRQIGPDHLLIEVAGRRIVAQAECPHRRGRLRFGYLNSRTLRLTCPLHHSTFDLLTGRQVSGPPCGSLTVELLPDDVPPPRPPAPGDQEASAQ